MIIVLDSNEYILHLNNESLLLDKVINRFQIHINELIVKEVLRNLREDQRREFYKLLFNDIIVHDEKLPVHLLEKYKKLGFKKGDIEIAAFCDYTDATFLISENRHFLRSKWLKCKVLSLREFLKIVRVVHITF